MTGAETCSTRSTRTASTRSGNRHPPTEFGAGPMDEIDVNRPPESSQADVTLVTRGITVTACVDVSTDFSLVVSPQGEGSAGKATVDDGDKVEGFWVAGNEERTLPARIVEVDAGERPRWHLAPTGPAQRSQRRKAVRARVA